MKINNPISFSSLPPLTEPNWKPKEKKGFHVVHIDQPPRTPSRMEKSRASSEGTNGFSIMEYSYESGIGLKKAQFPGLATYLLFKVYDPHLQHEDNQLSQNCTHLIWLL